ncbi:MAG: hypothetical protein BVN35_12575 [Proteobacteria bacterium ST_bin11]|nr:MAG: hypothetical protein BVN35_12575 [Proteobacteria bacterium ST_bin11]
MDSSALWGLFGTVVGASASIAAAWLAARSSHNLEIVKSQGERIEQARAFQRQTLLELQEAVHDVLRLICHIHHEDLLAHRAGQEWGKIMLPDEMSEGARLAFRRVSIVVERVADDHLREIVKHLMGGATQALLAKSELEASSQLDMTMQQSELIFQEIGTVLRRYY